MMDRFGGVVGHVGLNNLKALGDFFCIFLSSLFLAAS